MSKNSESLIKNILLTLENENLFLGKTTPDNCELRADFRHFRTDRIVRLATLETRYPKRRQTLLKKWREVHNIPDQ